MRGCGEYSHSFEQHRLSLFLGLKISIFNFFFYKSDFFEGGGGGVDIVFFGGDIFRGHL